MGNTPGYNQRRPIRIVAIKPLPDPLLDALQACPAEYTLQVLEHADAIREVAQARYQPTLILTGQLTDLEPTLHALRTAQQYWPTTPSLVLTRAGCPEDATALIFVSMRGYLLWSSPTPTVLAAIDLIAQGGYVCGPQLAPRMLERVVARSGDESGRVVVSEREALILALLAQHCSNAAIAEHIQRSIKAVEYHIHQLFSKIGVGTRRELAQWWMQRVAALRRPYETAEQQAMHKSWDSARQN